MPGYNYTSVVGQFVDNTYSFEARFVSVSASVALEAEKRHPSVGRSGRAETELEVISHRSTLKSACACDCDLR